METARTLSTADGIAIAYRHWSSGPHARTTMLIHGVASNKTRWSEFVENTALKHMKELLCALAIERLATPGRELCRILLESCLTPAVAAGVR